MSNFKKRSSFKGKGPGTIWLLLLIIALGMAYLFWYNSITREREAIAYSTFLTQVDTGNVKAVAISDQQLQGELRKPSVLSTRDGRLRQVSFFETTILAPERLVEKLHEHKVSSVLVKQGIPFVPSFLIAYLTLLFGKELIPVIMGRMLG